MKVYDYNHITKEYTGSSDAQKNPMRPHEYLIPANSTTIKPPNELENKARVFNGENWEYINDYRGQIQINLSTMQYSTVNYIGDIQEGYTLISEETLNDLMIHPECYKVEGEELKSLLGTDEYKELLEKAFNENFIKTNIGYIRAVTKWGNFISLLPMYADAVKAEGYLEKGNLILYNKPDFDYFKNHYKEDVEQWLDNKDFGQFENDNVSAEDFTDFTKDIRAWYKQGL